MTWPLFDVRTHRDFLPRRSRDGSRSIWLTRSPDLVRRVDCRRRTSLSSPPTPPSPRSPRSSCPPRAPHRSPHPPRSTVSKIGSKPRTSRPPPRPGGVVDRLWELAGRRARRRGGRAAARGAAAAAPRRVELARRVALRGSRGREQPARAPPAARGGPRRGVGVGAVPRDPAHRRRAQRAAAVERGGARAAARRLAFAGHRRPALGRARGAVAGARRVDVCRRSRHLPGGRLLARALPVGPRDLPRARCRLATSSRSSRSSTSRTTRRVPSTRARSRRRRPTAATAAR